MAAAKSPLGGGDFMDDLVPGARPPAATAPAAPAPPAAQPPMAETPTPAPLEPVSPPAEVLAEKGEKLYHFGFKIKFDILERFRNASWHLRIPVVRLIAEALSEYIVKIEQLNNAGEPFPQRQGALRRDVSTD